MDAMIPLALGSLKGLVLLAVATAVTLTLRRRTARLRAVVWGTAIAGCLVIPLVAPLLPAWNVPVPAALERFTSPARPETMTITQPAPVAALAPAAVDHRNELATSRAPRTSIDIDWTTVVAAIWLLGAGVLLVRLGLGSWRVQHAIRTARPVTGPHWRWFLGDALARAGCRRDVRLLWSTAVEVPATIGLLRPTIMLPPGAATWLDDRRRAVLLHEAIHVARFDWPVRTIARVARAVYWFNPLIWWAVRRLDLEQELACDEEVLAFGTGASDYACHLLGIARHAVPTPAPAIPALGMARRTHLEERIMTILKRTTPRRVGLAVLLPAAILIAAMVPALASVYPGQSDPRPAGPEIKQIMTEMRDVEAKMKPHLDRIENFEIEMQPKLEELQNIEVTIDDSKIAELEEQMKPYLERIEAIEIDMEPYKAQIEALEEQLKNVQLHIEDGTLEEVERQIHEQIEQHMQQFEQIHIDMEPYMQQIEAIHEEMSDLHQEMARVQIDMEPIHEQMVKVQIDLEPLHEEMEKLEQELEPFHEEMEILGERLEHALQSEVIGVLRDTLGAVVAPGTPFDEAAARIADDANINIDEDTLTFRASKRRTREVLHDLISEHRVGTQEAFDQAVESAVNALAPLVITAD